MSSLETVHLLACTILSWLLPQDSSPSSTQSAIRKTVEILQLFIAGKTSTAQSFAMVALRAQWPKHAELVDAISDEAQILVIIAYLSQFLEE